MKGSFPAMLFRMKYINRWGLMYNTQTENLSQHTVECAFLVHFLANIGNVYFGKSYDPEKLATYALYHDCPEVLTGDLPTPIKYYSEDMRRTYKQIEAKAAQKMLEYLPDELMAVYSGYMTESGINAEEKNLLKIADRLCAYIKCILEMNAGNREFASAQSSILRDLEAFKSDELKYFMDNCLGFFSLSLHDLRAML